MQPVAYLRKSKVTSDRHVSWQVQEAAVAGLRALLGMIERGEVSALYACSPSPDPPFRRFVSLLE